MECRRIDLTIDSRLEEVRKVRKAIAALAGEVPFSPEDWARVKTCVAEAVNNAVIHAYGGESGHRVEVTVLVDRKGVSCRIVDRGRPMPAELLRERRTLDFSPENVADLPEGGMGLYIIRQVMDRVDYRSEKGKNILTLVKKAGQGGSKD